MEYFLGVNGGQNYTTALIADAQGQIVGRGRAAASNSARRSSMRERLERAVSDSVSDALREADLLQRGSISEFIFHSAHLAIPGEPEEKADLVSQILKAEHLTISHRSPAMLAGALAAQSGIIVFAGTSSLAYGEIRKGGSEIKSARIGGHGFLFSDEGSAFAIARDALAFALRQEDRGLEKAQMLKTALLMYFKRNSLKAIADDCYSEKISRDQLASFTSRLDRLAQQGEAIAIELFETAAESLAEMAEAAAIKLGVTRRRFCISYNGNLFKSRLLLKFFAASVKNKLPKLQVVAPRFGPEAGALLLAYQGAGKKVTEHLLSSIGD